MSSRANARDLAPGLLGRESRPRRVASPLGTTIKALRTEGCYPEAGIWPRDPGLKQIQVPRFARSGRQKVISGQQSCQANARISLLVVIPNGEARNLSWQPRIETEVLALLRTTKAVVQRNQVHSGRSSGLRKDYALSLLRFRDE